MALEHNKSNMTSITAASTTTTTMELNSKSRGSTPASYCRIIHARMNVTKRQRPRIGLPISNLLSSFGPIKRKNKNESLAITDAILDDVLATIVTSATTTNAITSDAMPQHRELVQSVSFSTETEVHYIPSRNEISWKEYKAAWYSGEELESISESCLELIHSITSNSNHFGTTVDDDDEESCYMRGLESFTPVALVAKNMNRSSSVQAVLSEQNRQQEQQQQQRRGCEDEADTTTDDHGAAETIRMIYYGISASSQLWAQAVALKDRREVEDMTLDDEEYCSDKTSAITKTTVGVVEEQQEVSQPEKLQGGGLGRRRAVFRSYSANSTYGGTMQQSKKPSKLSPKMTGKTPTCRLEATGPLDPEEAAPQMVMATAA